MINDKYKMNYRNLADGLDLLAHTEDCSITTGFFDPQYRGVLDKLNYGNEGARQKGRVDLPQMSEDIIKDFIKEYDRVLKPSGHLFLWVDKFHLCQGIQSWLKDTDLNLVDLIVWDKGKIGMGYRTRRKSEYLLVLQKSPVRAKGKWNDHAIPDVWLEKVVKTKDTHPHIKPVELIKRLITATTQENDVVLDAASGGYSVMQACMETNRNFLGGDIKFGEMK